MRTIATLLAFLDNELRAEGERAGVVGFVNKRDIAQLPDVIRAAAAN